MVVSTTSYELLLVSRTAVITLTANVTTITTTHFYCHHHRHHYGYHNYYHHGVLTLLLPLFEGCIDTIKIDTIIGTISADTIDMRLSCSRLSTAWPRPHSKSPHDYEPPGRGIGGGLPLTEGGGESPLRNQNLLGQTKQQNRFLPCGLGVLLTPLDLCASSLRRDHANLLYIVPILMDEPRREPLQSALNYAASEIQSC